MTPPVVAVVGATGFLGRHVVDRLQTDGWHVRALTRRLDLAQSSLGPCEVVQWSGFEDAASLDAALRGTAAVVNLAANAHKFGGTPEEKNRLADANVAMAVAVAGAAAEAGTRRVLLVSSVGARDASGGNDPYASSKHRAEVKTTHRLASTKSELVVVRPPMIYGEGMKGRPLRLFEMVARGFPIPMPAGSNARSVAYAGNVAASIAFLIKPETPLPTQPVYPADNGATSTETLIRMIGDALERRVRIIPVPRAILTVAGALGSITRRRIVPVDSSDVERAFSTLVVDNAGAFPAGGAPISTADGLRRAAVWFREARA